MSKHRAIGSHVRLAFEYSEDASLLGPERRNSAGSLFYAVENLIMATLESEGIERSEWRPKAGNHQLDRMIDALPEDCSIKPHLRNFETLTAYATTFRYPTPSGRIPPSPSSERMAEWLDGAKQLTRQFAVHFEVDLGSQDPVAGRIAPFRESLDHDQMEP